MAKCRLKGDVEWYLPNRKRPVAYSTKAASDLIVLLAQEYNTIQEIYAAITYDMEAKSILEIYIEKGYGSAIGKDFFR